MKNPIEVSDSQFKSFQGCQRKWAYQKLLHLTADEDKDQLILGNAWHDGAEEFIKTGSMDKAIASALASLAKDKPTAIEYQKLLVPAMLIGWATHWLPPFLAEYEYVALEEWFSSEPNPDIIRIRGFKDLVALHKETRRRCVFDYKTSSEAYARDLIACIDSNNQLARYATAERRQYGEWPMLVGLVFIMKPKAKDPMVAIGNARSDPSLYKSVIKQVTPQFAQYALEVERNDVVMAAQMKHWRDRIAAEGPMACEDIPANFDNCFNYGKFCGFSQGCHSGCPAHRNIPKVR